MHSRFLLLWVLCALATALPQSGKSLETTKEPEELDSNSATQSIVIEDISSLFTSSTTNPPLNTTTEGTLQLPQIAPTAPSAVSEDDVATSTTTAKPESKVINVKHAADLITAMSKAGDKLVVIFVVTSWCGFSRRLEPGVEEVARSTDNVLVFKIVHNKVDTSEDWKYDDQWRLEDADSYPYIFILKNGKKYDQYVGGDAELLQTKVNEYLTPPVE